VGADMLQLLLLMFERLAIIVMVAFLMTRVRYFRTLIEQRNVTNLHRFVVMLMFGLFGIIGTYTGLTVDIEASQAMKWSIKLNEDEAIANSRVIGVVIGGLVGGWKVGLGAGLIAGVHRFTLGGFTAFACGLSTIVAGILAGVVHRFLHKKSPLSPNIALLVGITAESLQMLMIVLVARPYESAILLVQAIGLPMIVANGLGSALFILIIRNVIHGEEKIGAFQAQKSLLLAKLTSAHLRKGLTEQSAQATCEILLNEVKASAVAITNKTEILAHVGKASDHHHKNELIQTEATKKVLEKGKMLVASRNVIHCQRKTCPLQAAVIAPLYHNEEVIGTLKFYFTSEQEIKKVTVEFIKGLASLLSQQLQIANAEKYYQLAKDAEIKALQAQVSPHFLFNTLNTIVSMIRTEPLQARKLLVSLSKYFRHNLAGANQELTTLARELDHVKAYLAIEAARFKDKLEVDFEIDEAILYFKIPPMTLQPIIENAIKHGFKGIKTGSKISVKLGPSEGGVYIEVSDNGVGIDQEKQKYLLIKPAISKTGTGLGLHNVNRRLIIFFGESSQLQLNSSVGNGTTISFFLPYLQKGDEIREANS
jgi:two-component system sensor histidine kinase LytS